MGYISTVPARTPNCRQLNTIEPKTQRVEHGETKHPLTKKSLSYDHLHHKLSNLQPRHRLHSFTSIYIYTYIHTFNYCFKKTLIRY